MSDVLGSHAECLYTCPCFPGQTYFLFETLLSNQSANCLVCNERVGECMTKTHNPLNGLCEKVGDTINLWVGVVNLKHTHYLGKALIWTNILASPKYMRINFISNCQIHKIFTQCHRLLDLFLGNINLSYVHLLHCSFLVVCPFSKQTWHLQLFLYSNAQHLLEYFTTEVLKASNPFSQSCNLQKREIGRSGIHNVHFPVCCELYMCVCVCEEYNG